MFIFVVTIGFATIFIAMVIATARIRLKAKKEALKQLADFEGTAFNIDYDHKQAVDTFLFPAGDQDAKIELGQISDIFLSDQHGRYLFKGPRWPSKDKGYELEHPSRKITISKSFNSIRIDDQNFELRYSQCFHGKIYSGGKLIAQFLMQDYSVRLAQLKEGDKFFAKVLDTDDVLKTATFITAYFLKVHRDMERKHLILPF